MKVVKVNVSNPEKILVINLEVGNTRKVFRRPLDEVISRTLERMMVSLSQNKKKKKQSKSNELQGCHDESLAHMTVSLLGNNNEKVCADEKGVIAWESASFLKINNDSYKVLFNPPSVNKIAISKQPLVGMPMTPILQFSSAFTKYSRFSWYRLPRFAKDIEKMECDDNEVVSFTLRKRLRSSLDNSDGDEVNDNNFSNDTSLISEEVTYTPNINDVGHAIKLEVIPGNELYPSSDSSSLLSAVSAVSGIVQCGPEFCLFDQRQIFTNLPCLEKNKFRVVCYNILADCYATTELALNTLFPYCSKEFLDMDYRIQLIQRELIGYNSDILCLQEVDRFVFEDYLAPVMALHDFAAAFGNKSRTKEGVALFYRRNKFKLLSVENKVLSESLQKDELNLNLKKFVHSNTKLQSRFASLGTCVLISTLQSIENENKYMVVLNTHLYFHPRAANVRLIQILVVLNLLHEKLSWLKESLSDDACISFIISGDLNSNPRTAVIEYLLTGNLPYSHADWYSGGVEEFHLNKEKSSFTHNFNLVSACGFPTYTNYAAGFNECLDYIFIDSNLIQVDRIIEMPDHKNVTEHSGLPSRSSPSDHIAQVVDLTWKPA